MKSCHLNALTGVSRLAILKFQANHSKVHSTESLPSTRSNVDSLGEGGFDLLVFFIMFF